MYNQASSSPTGQSSRRKKLFVKITLSSNNALPQSKSKIFDRRRAMFPENVLVTASCVFLF